MLVESGIWKFFVESVILDFGIRNTAQEIWNPTWIRIRNPELASFSPSSSPSLQKKKLRENKRKTNWPKERYQWCLTLKTLEIKTHLGHNYLHTVSAREKISTTKVY